MKEAENLQVAQYLTEITNYAASYGFKAANLMFLQAALIEDKASKISVPAFQAVASQNIISHLGKNAPEWKKNWEEFCDIQKGNPEIISPKAEEKLLELQKIIKECFATYPFNIDVVPEGELLMVRSTSNEDRVDVANPGGNESIPSKPTDLSNSIGVVIASYFSVKSLSQRIKLKEDVTKELPLLACLIQKMIGEKQRATSKATKSTIVSGVIYTDGGNIRIQAAPGHGELIVNSKGRFDNYYVTENAVVYSEIRDKSVRLIANFNEQTKKMELIELGNSFELATKPSLDEQTVRALADISNKIEKLYGMRMDIEFAYDPKNKQINIVQARAIPIGSRKGLIPSALSKDFIANKKPITIKGSVITPDIRTASIITSKDEILICDTIEEALNSFLNNPKKLKGVIIQKDAPDTSHEAGMFTSMAIPVLQVNKFKQAHELVNQLKNKLLVLDPQNNGLFQIEQAEFSNDLIKDGIFKSTLTPHVTVIKQKFVESQKEKVAEEFDEKEFGALIEKAATDEKASNQLEKYLAKITNISKANRRYNLKNPKFDLEKDLEKLSLPLFNQNNQEQRETLANILLFARRMRKQDLISPELFAKIMITGGELNIGLSQIERSPSNDRIMKNYLDIYQKFQGLISSQGKAHILSTSLVRELHNNKINKQYFELTQGHNLTPRQQELFLEVVKLDKFIIQKEDKDKWYKFCLECCKSNKGLILGNLVKELVKFGLHEYWVNTMFLEEYDKQAIDLFLEEDETPKDNILANLYQNFDNGHLLRDGLIESSKIIARMENQIARWKDPKLFPSLYMELQENLKQIDKLLVIDNTNPLNAQLAIKQLNQLVDVIDLSIKALQNSAEYEDKKQQQVKNFKAMLGDFFDLMKKWKVDDKNVEQLDDRIKSIEDFFKNTQNDAKELLTSRNFSAIAASLYQPLFHGFTRGFTDIYDKTLADFHTLVHQSLLSSVGRRSKGINKSLENKAPEFVRSMENHLISKQTYLGFENFQKAGTPELIWSNLQSPNLDMHYNIPLHNHSGYLDIKYNYQRKTAKLSFQLFGLDAERWRDVKEFGSILIASETDALITKAFSGTNFMTIEVEINEHTKNIKELVEILSTLGLATLDDNLTLKRAFEPRGLYYEKLESSSALMKVIKDSRDVEGDLDYKTIIAIIASYKEISQEVRDKLNLERNIHLLRNGYVNIEDILQAQNEDELYKIAIPNIIIEQKNILCHSIRKVSDLWDKIKSIPDIKNKQILINSINKVLKTELHPSGFTSDLDELSRAISEKYTNNGMLQLIAAIVIDDSFKPENYPEIFNKNSHNFKKNIQNLDYNKSKYLASDNAVACYKNEDIQFFELQELDLDKIMALTSPEAQACYRNTNFVKLYMIQDFDIDKIKALTSPNALACYKGDRYYSYIRLHELTELNSEDIVKFTKARYYPLYQKRLTIANVKELAKIHLEDPAKCKALMSPTALACYEGKNFTKYIEFNDLIQLTLEDINKYTKEEYHQYYELKLTLKNVMDLDKLPSAKYQALTSPEAIICYRTNYITFDELQSFDTDKIKALTSPEALACYKGDRYYSYIRLHELTELNSEDIVKFTKARYYPLYQKRLTIANVKELAKIHLEDPAKYQALTSPEAIICYRTNYITFDKLKTYDTDTIKALTSPEAIACYRGDRYNDNYIKFDKLKEYDVDKIKTLTSPDALACYRGNMYNNVNYIKFDKLESYDADKIKALISPDAIACYKDYFYNNINFNSLKDFDVEKIKALTSPEALACYQSKYVDFNKLKDFDIDKIKALTSPNFLNSYQNKFVKFDDLKSLDIDEIKNLDIRLSYKIKWPKTRQNDMHIKDLVNSLKENLIQNDDDIASCMTDQIVRYLSADKAQKGMINNAIRQELQDSKKLLQDLNNLGSWQKSFNNNIAWKILYNIIDAIGKAFGIDSKEERLIKPIKDEITNMINNITNIESFINR